MSKLTNIIDGSNGLYCECSSPECLARLSISQEEYMTIRTRHRSVGVYILLPGCEQDANDIEVERTTKYVVVKERS